MPGALQRLPSPAVIARVSDLVGHTPLLEFARTGNGTRLMLKLEMFNPTGTTDVRIARQMINDAEEQGRLRPGGRIIECASADICLGIAAVAAERGYHFTAVVDHRAPAAKLRSMQAMGAELVYLSDGGSGSWAATTGEEYCERMARSRDDTVFTGQRNNPGSGAGAGSLLVAHELHEALGGELDLLIGAVGSGGSLCGTARELHTLLSDFVVIGVEPKGSTAFGGPAYDYHQPRTGVSEGAAIGALIDFDLIDEGVKVGDVEAFATCRSVARTGLLIGGSAGGVVYEAMKRMPLVPPGTTMVALVNDGGEGYLDTIFNDAWMHHHGLLSAAAEREIDMVLARLRRH